MIIEPKLITSNNKGKAGSNKPKFIVIHDTGNANKGAGAENHYKWLQNNNDLKRSAHLFVDSKQALQVIDYFTIAYHTGVLYTEHPEVPTCTNFNSIGIEFCVNEDGDLEKTLENTIEATKRIMKLLNIPSERVITHQMSSGKKCPGTFIKKPELWEYFKEKIKEELPKDEVLEAGLKYLQENKVMQSPDYWNKKIAEVPHLRELILNMIEVLKKAQEKE